MYWRITFHFYTNKHCSIFEDVACGTRAAFSCPQTWDGGVDRKLSPSFTPRSLKTENKQAVKNKGALEGARGVKLQQQLVYPGMAARMLTLPFTSHLLPYHQQSLVHIPSWFLLSPTVYIHVFSSQLSLLLYVQSFLKQQIHLFVWVSRNRRTLYRSEEQKQPSGTSVCLQQSRKFTFWMKTIHSCC